jgi:hypothetical protein
MPLSSCISPKYVLGKLNSVGGKGTHPSQDLPLPMVRLSRTPTVHQPSLLGTVRCLLYKSF